MWHSGWHRHNWRRTPRFAPEWEHKRRFLFIRFAWLLAWVVLIFILSIGGLAFLMTRLFGGDNQTVLLVWLSGCALAVVLPLLLVGLVFRSFARLANPLARVMAAADAVADGDLSARATARRPCG